MFAALLLARLAMGSVDAAIVVPTSDIQMIGFDVSERRTYLV
jgi:hypothetical protein